MKSRVVEVPISIGRTAYQGRVDVDWDLIVKVRVQGATQAYFSKSFGNYLPGDPGEVEILSAATEHGEVFDVEMLNEDEIERIEMAAMEVEPPEPDYPKRGEE